MTALFASALYFFAIISFLQNWLLLAIFFTILFSLRFGAVALIPAAILIDGYFGNYYGLPLLSLGAIVWFMLVEYVRPKIIDLNSV